MRTSGGSLLSGAISQPRVSTGASLLFLISRMFASWSRHLLGSHWAVAPIFLGLFGAITCSLPDFPDVSESLFAAVSYSIFTCFLVRCFVDTTAALLCAAARARVVLTPWKYGETLIAGVLFGRRHLCRTNGCNRPIMFCSACLAGRLRHLAPFTFRLLFLNMDDTIGKKCSKSQLHGVLVHLDY